MPLLFQEQVFLLLFGDLFMQFMDFPGRIRKDRSCMQLCVLVFFHCIFLPDQQWQIWQYHTLLKVVNNWFLLSSHELLVFLFFIVIFKHKGFLIVLFYYNLSEQDVTTLVYHYNAFQLIRDRSFSVQSQFSGAAVSYSILI